MLPLLSKEQIVERYDTLPENLQNAFFLPANSEEAIRICKLNHLSDDKITRVSRVGVYVFLGFIDIDDFAKEIHDYAAIPPEVAGVIAREFRRKIFSLYEKDIAKVYAPFGAAGEEAKKTVKEAAPAAAQKEKVAPVTMPAPLPMPIEAGKIPAPVPLPKVVEEMRVAPQAAIAAPVPAPAAPSLPSAPPRGELAEPFILHKEETVKPIGGAKPIDLSFSLPETKKETAVPIVAAELELDKESFGVSEKKEPLIAKTEEPTQRIVHYSEFRTPINPFEGKPNPPIPITPPTAKEAIPAPAPMASTPPPARIPAASAIPAPTAPQPPAAPIPPEPMPLSPAPAPNVKMEGNVVDLRQK